jgi:hypothetical protein
MTETANAAPTFRYVGVTDECVVCQKCGKPNLRSTVVLAFLDADGNEEEYTYYGSTCAARALNVTGRSAGARVLGLARAAHRALVLAAYDGRRMLADYGLPETGGLTPDQVHAATLHYADIHHRAAWASNRTYQQWREMTLDMVKRKQAALAEAAALGVIVPTTDRERDTFVNTF